MPVEKGMTGFELGKVFYTSKIEESKRKLKGAQDTYHKLEAQDQIETYELKLSQLLRREELKDQI